MGKSFGEIRWEENVEAVASAGELVVRCNPVVFTMDVAGVPRRSGIGLEVRGDDDASCIKQVCVGPVVVFVTC